MKFRFIVYSLYLFFSFSSFAQVQIKKYENLISSNAYSKKISEDFNYLILGDNSPQQGVSAVLNDDRSNIKINGLLYSGMYGVINLEADLSASDGIYYFDKNNGSENGKISFNYYRPIKKWSKYYPLNNYTKASVQLQILELIAQTKTDYDGLKKLVKEILGDEIIDDDSDITKTLKILCEKYINSDDKLGYHELEDLNMIFDRNSYFNKGQLKIQKDSLKIIIEEGLENKNIVIKELGLKKISKILKDYTAKKRFISKKLEDSINKLEIENVKSQWAGNHIFFIGISPFYERQSFKRFSYDNSKTFSEMFSKERGNLYGVTLSLNYSLENGEGNRNIYKPESLFFKLSASFNRASNMSNFKNNTLNISSPIGNDVNGNPIQFNDSDKAFIGDSIYEYGFGSLFSLEAYYYPFPVDIGVFGKISYNNVTFNKGSVVKDIEEYPMRIGLLFSLKNKEKNKSIVTIQTFLDRTDLNLSPNGNDNDLRFGLGVGLPIKIKS